MLLKLDLSLCTSDLTSMYLRLLHVPVDKHVLETFACTCELLMLLMKIDLYLCACGLTRMYT